MPPGRGSAAGEILALPYYSHRGLRASMRGLRRARSVYVSLRAFSLDFGCIYLLVVYLLNIAIDRREYLRLHLLLLLFGFALCDCRASITVFIVLIPSRVAVTCSKISTRELAINIYCANFKSSEASPCSSV